ncbi:MAG: recombinase RecA [Candidatus Rokubacteria bacterium GWC2_70_16]|nr:MAG: recombinase RecA [Candidatus Rokubacteria bacterium GWC2_70_16]
MAEVKSDRRQALELALASIDRQFGKGAIMRLGQGGAFDEIAVIPTGALSLDVALGIGGIPRGRVTEIYGPESSGKTTLALHVIAEAQRAGGTAAFIDAEHALDPIYAKNLGVNTDELLISQPDTGEQALEIAETLVRSNAVDVIVIDSVAALVPRAELDGDMGDSLPGLQARLMSQALRKLTAAISRSGGSVIFINQIREKIGVMFGCLHYGTRVTLADGTSEKIGKIVNQRRQVEVLSYDPATGRIEPRRIVNWFDNGRTDHFIQFEVEGGPSGRRRFAATENHLVFTPHGRVRAGGLEIGSEVLVSVKDYVLTDDQWQLVLGGGLGDGSLRRTGAHAAHFRVGHGEAQKDYLRWKHWMLEPFAGAIKRTGNGWGFDTLATPALADLLADYYGDGRSRIASAGVLDRLDARGLAVWYGDDGSFGGSYTRWGKGKAVLYNTALSGDSRQRVMVTLERLGIGRPRDDGRGFWFDAERTARLHELIARYLHPSVDYKIHPTLRGRFAWHPQGSEACGLAIRLEDRARLRAVPARIIKRYVKPPSRATHRFDLEIEGHHTYLADGVVVHNSPETTTGGRALKFYSSIRLDIRRQDTIKNGTESVGVRTKVKVVKNKLAPPFREAEFDVIYGEGISKEGSVLDAAVEQNVVEKSGTWYTYKSERIGQGRENAKRYLKENAKTLLDLEAKVRAALGLRPVGGTPAAAADKPEKPAR